MVEEKKSKTVAPSTRIPFEENDDGLAVETARINPTLSTDYCMTADGTFDEDVMLCAGDEVYDSCTGDLGDPTITAKQVVAFYLTVPFGQKTSNIFLDSEGNIRMGDFGLATLRLQHAWKPMTMTPSITKYTMR